MSDGDRASGTVPESAQAPELFRSLVQQSPDMVSLYDGHGAYAWSNAAHERVLGYRADELVGRFPLDFLHPDEAESVAIEFAAQLRGERSPAPVEMRFRCRDGSYKHLEAVAVDLTDEPAVGGVLVTGRDVSDRRRAEQVVQAHAAILERIARGASLGDTLAAVCGMIERWVPRGVAVVLRVEGAPPAVRIASAPMMAPELRVLVEAARVNSALAAELREGLVVSPIGSHPLDPGVNAAFEAAGLAGWWGAPVFAPDGERVLGSTIVFLPSLREPEPFEEQLLVTAGSLAAIAIERDRVQARLHHQASHDTLTGLPNRDQLVERLDELSRTGGQRWRAAVYFLDLDRFKVFNDSVGHDAGDRILVEMSERLRGAIRDGDSVARFGGDEFVVVCKGLDGVEHVAALGERLLDVVSRPFAVADTELVVSASIGVALVDGRPAEELLRDADAAMYHAKERGRARIELFDDTLRARVVERMHTERDLRRAIDADAVSVYYQPVVSLRTGRLSGFEALARWEHPVRGMLAADDFLDVAEETGLIARVGANTRAEAFRQWSEWRRRHPEWGDFLMAVNLAAAELRDSSLPAQIAALLAQTRADPRSIVVEVTERVLAADTRSARSVLTKLRGLGLILALDDFGTGSSPLLHLRQFPIHAVKLDGALVAGLGVNRDDNVIVESVIALAHRLGMFAIAEGVETSGQIDRLCRYGCLLGQGHVYAPAMPEAEAEAWAVECSVTKGPRGLGER